MLTQEQKNKLKRKSWRMRNLYKIRNRDSELVTFKENKVQKHFNEHKHTRNIILKSRQIGITTYEVIDSMDDCLTQKNFNMLLISYDKDSAVDIFDEKARLAWDNISLDVKNLWELEIARANTMKFKHSPGVYSSFKVRIKGRSGTFSRVHISEFGKICKESVAKAKEIVSGTFPAVPLDGRIDIESTAEGEEGRFHDMFWEAWLNQQDGRELLPSEFKAHFYNWTWDEKEIAKIKKAIPVSEMDQSETFAKYQETHNLSDIEITYYYTVWKTIVGKDWRLMNQEYPTTPEEAFVSSGDKLFDSNKITEMIAQVTLEGKKEGDWTIYEEYIPGHRYALAGDVAEGLGQDSSTIVIIDFTYLKPKVVATYKSNKIEPDVFAYEVKAGAVRYGTCLVAVENNNMGRSTLDILKTIYNEDMIFTMKRNDKVGEEQETQKLGWNTNSASKPIMFFDLNTAVNQELIEIHDKHLLHEMRIYTKEKLRRIKGDEEATNHFDLLTALAICWQMRTYAQKVVDYTGYQVGGVEPFDVSLGI